MTLTGKTKEEFEIYYIVKTRKDRPDYNNFSKENILKKFYRKNISEQIGVLILYFDSVGIFILSSENNSSVSNKTNIFFHCKEDREQAWTQAVKKANEIREEQL